MFESLTERLHGVLKGFRNEARITVQHVDKSMHEIRIALLEADVNFKVAKDFISGIREKALGEKVLQSLSPGQQVVKIVRDELVILLGVKPSRIHFSKTPPTVILLVGLQGSGKTTTAGKLGLFLKRQESLNPILVSTDVRRPAAIKQLDTIAEAIELPVFSDPSGDPVVIAKKALQFARNGGFDVLLVDTAGRLHIDLELMTELGEIKRTLEPTETILIADSMTGQDAVNSASRFDDEIGLTGVILSKLDGDARGGAALSIRSVTGKPIKFVGTGEKYEAIEPFHPQRLANRILGMGDILSLIEKAETVVDAQQAEEMLRKVRRRDFTLDDFLSQLKQVQKLGPLNQILGMLPKTGHFKSLSSSNVTEKQLRHVEAIISSMTLKERLNYRIINGPRRKRISLGCGRPVSEVNRLLKQFLLMRKLLSKGLLGKKLPNFSLLF
jgi:signal recognition particle subunit SRP54